MKINVKQLCLFVTMSMAAGLWTSEQVRAQDRSWEIDTNRRAEAVAKAAQSIQPTQGGQQPVVVRPSSPYATDPFSGGPRTLLSRAGSGAIRKAAEAVRDAKNDDAKSAAQKLFADLLSKSYDEDMAQRERELKQIEERLTKLRDLLSRRRSKKQDIIDLQIKVALNEADGLGFYENERPAKSVINYYDYKTVSPRIENRPTSSSSSSSALFPAVDAPKGLPDVEASSNPAPSAGPTPTPSKELDR